VEVATIDARTIADIQAELAGLRPSIPSQYDYAFYFDPSQQRVVLYSNGAPSLFASVTAKFGDHLKYINGFTLATRHSDNAPHWGGAVIVGPYFNHPGYITGCTTGFTVIHAGSRYELTAGHCFPTGSSNALYNGPGLSGYYMGYAWWQADTMVDAELVSGSSYSAYIYISESNWAHVTSAGDPVVNMGGYCASGINSGETCSHTDTSNSATVCEGGYLCAVNVSVFQGGGQTQEGDSGAPVYLRSGDVAARGMLIAIAAGSIFWAEDWSQLSNYFGLSIATTW
jgi:hypothetical protein